MTQYISIQNDGELEITFPNAQHILFAAEVWSLKNIDFNENCLSAVFILTLLADAELKHYNILETMKNDESPGQLMQHS